jgi:hypothetical protein
VRQAIEEAFYRNPGTTAAAIRRVLGRDKRYAGRVPEDRAVRKIIAPLRSVLEAAEADTPWLFDGADSPEDARLIMDLLAGHESLRIQAREAGDVVPRFVRPSRELARLIVRIRRAYPAMPAQAASTFAYQYLAVRGDGAAASRLDYELAHWGSMQEQQEETDDQA